MISPDTISSESAESVDVSIKGATEYKITRYDEISVDLTYLKGVDKIAVVTVTAGSPYIQLSALSDLTISLGTTNIAATKQSNVLYFKSAQRQYVAAGFAGATMELKAGQPTASIKSGGMVSLFGLTAGQRASALLEHAGSRILGANVKFGRPDQNQYSTEIRINTKDSEPTVFSSLPHQKSSLPSLLAYDTIYGQQKLHVGNKFITTTKTVPVVDSLNFAKLSAGEKTMLTDTLRREINATNYTATDTYFSGKELYSSAQLLNLAYQLNESDIASTIQTKLRQELVTWLSTNNERTQKYFYYDSKLMSIVGESPSFGSEDANDHHFHYGYFIYSAGILGKYDKEFVKSYQDQVNLLVADIANYKSTEDLPQRRVFDPFFGHSWASGSSPFNAGNNQESISEALNAWTGISIWAMQTKNSELAEQANWMLSVESAAAKAYWLDINHSQAPFNSTYSRSIVPLNWGGKRDYSTFFSAAPSAKLGILLLPMNPTSQALFPDKQKIDRQIKESATGDYNIQFGDYLLMYSTSISKPERLKIAQAMPEQFIDSANSRSYMLAWILSYQP